MKKVTWVMLLVLILCAGHAVSAQMQAGDTVTFGHYEQDNDISDGPEPIEWQVLTAENGQMLLLSRYGLEVMPYHSDFTDVTWEDCDLRRWLNGDFFQSAFDASEKERIILSDLDNPDNPVTGAGGGKSTSDHVFLLDIREAEQYLPSDDARKTELNAYAAAKNAQSDGGYGRWWLRTPGGANFMAAYVISDGRVGYSGDMVDFGRYLVRPAIWIAGDTGNNDRVEHAVIASTSMPPDVSALSEFQFGDTFLFGQYEQDNDLSNDAEPIEWIVLAPEADRVLVMSKYGLIMKPYNTSWSYVTWETCSLRSWLNEDFYLSAFTGEEKSRIALVTLSNKDNQGSGTSGDTDAMDRIFLLSDEEAHYYMSLMPNEFQCPVTEYAKASGAMVDGSNGASWWWLRTPGFASCGTKVIASNGKDIYAYGFGVSDKGAVVRPAFWLIR